MTESIVKQDWLENENPTLLFPTACDTHKKRSSLFSA